MTVAEPRPVVRYDGREYKVRSTTIEIPDLSAMDRFDALQWLCCHTYARGYSRPDPLRGLAGAIEMQVK